VLRQSRFFLLMRESVFCVFFFFQAEDGIRDRTVTGVQTCALPISPTLRALVRTTVCPPLPSCRSQRRIWWVPEQSRLRYPRTPLTQLASRTAPWWTSRVTSCRSVRSKPPARMLLSHG